MNTPRYHTRTLTAGDTQRVYATGRWFEILSLVGATTIGLGLDNDPPQSLPALVPMAIPDSAGAFNAIVLYNPAAVSVTVTLLTSMGEIGSGWAAKTTYTAVTGIALTTIAQTGVGETHIVTAAGGTRHVEVIADLNNTGWVYLRSTTGVTAANATIILQAGGSWNGDWAGDLFACSDNGTEGLRGSIYS